MLAENACNHPKTRHRDYCDGDQDTAILPVKSGKV